MDKEMIPGREPTAIKLISSAGCRPAKKAKSRTLKLAALIGNSYRTIIYGATTRPCIGAWWAQK
jgi:hypothetical protein